MYKLPENCFQVREVHIEPYYEVITNGANTYIKTEYDKDVPVEFSCYHPEIFADSPMDTPIELDPECLNILEYYVCASVSLDDREIYSFFYGEYQNSLANLSPSRTNKLAHFE